MLAFVAVGFGHGRLRIMSQISRRSQRQKFMMCRINHATMASAEDRYGESQIIATIAEMAKQAASISNRSPTGISLQRLMAPCRQLATNFVFRQKYARRPVPVIAFARAFRLVPLNASQRLGYALIRSALTRAKSF